MICEHCGEPLREASMTNYAVCWNWCGGISQVSKSVLRSAQIEWHRSKLPTCRKVKAKDSDADKRRWQILKGLYEIDGKEFAVLDPYSLKGVVPWSAWRSSVRRGEHLAGSAGPMRDAKWKWPTPQELGITLAVKGRSILFLVPHEQQHNQKS